MPFSKYDWKKKIAIFLNMAPKDFFNGFDIIDANTFNKVYSSMNKVDATGMSIGPIPISFNERVFIGHRMYNNLVVLMLEDPMMRQMIDLKERIADLKIRLPRFRFVLITGPIPDGIKSQIDKAGGYYFCINDFEEPSDLIQTLSTITVDPKNHPEIVQINEGGGI